MIRKGESSVLTPEPCTTQAKTKLHWSTKLDNPKYLGKVPGRRGRTLCGNGGMDEEHANYLLEKWSNKRITVLNLPECKSCARSRAAMGSDQAATDDRPYLCDGIAVGDQGQPYAECGLPTSHDPHPITTAPNATGDES